jgi:hypothetical protein
VEIFIVWLALSIVAGIIAAKKGRSGFGFFVLSLLLSPLIGIPAALVTKTSEQGLIARGEMKKCPYCAELIKAEANICRFCQREQTSPTHKVVGGIVVKE